jgi:outer membrane protein insertion porin family
MSKRSSLSYWVKLACAGVVFGATQAHAFEAFTVEEIRVEGLQRISAGTVFNYLPVKKGDRIDDSLSTDAIRALFKTGFFKDVVLERDGNTLVVFVVERPAIASIEVEGNVEIQKEPLMESLKSIGLVEGQVFDRSLLDQVEQELKRQYLAIGNYSAQVKTTVTPMERNRVSIKISVAEGEKATIQKVNIVGNRAFDEKALLERFELGVKPPISLFYSGDQYAKQKLSADLETLRSWYLDRGYINFSIDSTQVAITPDKQHIYITINITEGEQYTVSEVKVAGDTIVPEEEVRKLISLKPGEIFSRRELTASATRIGDRLGEVGYAFANINPIPDVDEAKREVKLTFFVDPGKRVYVRRINITGNERTNDEVLRRELRQMEGAPLEGAKIRRSETRLQRLNLFDSVNVDTKPVPGAPDLADVTYAVKEKSTFGSFNAGVGYGDTSGFQIMASVVEENFLGTGSRYSLNFNNAQTSTEYSLTFTDPYFTLDGVSRSGKLFYRTYNPGSGTSDGYTIDSFGAGLSYGVPISEYNTFNYGFDAEHNTINMVWTTDSSGKRKNTASSAVQQFCTDHASLEDCQYDAYTGSAGWSFDSRDRILFPTAGTLQSVNGSVAVPVGDGLSYYRLNYNHRHYTRLDSKGDYVLQLKGDVAYGGGYGNTNDLPPSEKYMAGGVRTIRGFRGNSLGPGDTDGNATGGNLRTLVNAELIFRGLISENSDSARFGLFVDGGNVFAKPENFSTEEFRYSTGLTLYWITPIGPLTFSYAVPLVKKPGDDTENFQFSLGTSL